MPVVGCWSSTQRPLPPRLRQQLAVHDHDIEAIIRTHAKARMVAARLEDTAEAFDEIGEVDLAIGWAKQATDFDRGHQSLKAAGYWCGLLEKHRPSEGLQDRVSVFRKWPSSTLTARRHKAAGTSWHDFGDEVVATLAASPSDAVLFALLTLKEPEFAWSLAPIFPASRHSPRAIGLHSSPSPRDHATFHATKCLESRCIQMFPEAFAIGRSAR